MQKDSKRIDPHTTGDIFLAGTIDIPRPDNDVGNSVSLAILDDDFVLFDFCEAIRLASELRMLLYRTRFIQQPPPRLLGVGVHREGANVDESSQAFV